MKSPLIVTVLLSAVASVAGAQASVQSDTGRTIIAASGQARQVAIPDRATLILLIEPQAMSVEEASNRLVAVEKAVLDTLRRFGLPANAIQSFSSGVAPYRNNMNPSMNGPSFAGRSMIRVELTRLDQLPAITSAALSKGASFVNSPTYTYSGADSVRRALLPQAFQTAQREAEVLARAAGGRLGRMLDLSSTSGPNFINEANQQIYMNSMGYDNGQRMIPSSTVTVSVTTRWVLIR
jgi:hypothetical protein